MRKKILIITDNLPDQINGVVTTFRNIEAAARGAGYDVEYLHPGYFPHRDCPGYPEVKLSWPWGIGKHISAISPDHVHIATEGPVGLAARLWLDWHGWRYNTSYHTRFPEFIHRMYRIPVGITYAYLRWFHKHSGRMLTTTDTMVRELRSRGFRGDIRAWTRGVDRDVFDAELRQRDGGLPVLLYVGRVSVEKNIEDFCGLDVPGAVKQVVGDGPIRSDLAQRYPDVEFLGYRSGRDLAACYANADVFVFPSVNDTFGIVMIEAMACGTPVAAYPVPGPQDVVSPGISGYLSDDLGHAVDICLMLDRNRVLADSQRWSWQHCWQIFQDNLVSVQ
jgi:glycosyltransferase involved in cell wall biosynthesis